MKKIGVIAFVVSFFVIGCLKGDDASLNTPACTPVPEASEISSIQQYAAKDTVTFKEDSSSGVFYHITAPGTGLAASTYSDLFFTYNASLLDGTYIGSSATPIQQQVANTIVGIQAMAEYLKVGTKIQMIIPSSLAYGCQPFSTDSVTVPANSVVVFNLNITNIQ